jgi:hypothetical protein
MGSKRSSRAGLAACQLRAALEISLSDDELYAVAAYILQLNAIIGGRDVMSAQTLPEVGMANRDGFVPFSGPK